MVSTHVICIAFLGSKEPMFSDSLYLHSDNKGAAIMCSHFAVLLIDFPICLSFLSVNCLFQESKFTCSCLLKFWHKIIVEIVDGSTAEQESTKVQCIPANIRTTQSYH